VTPQLLRHSSDSLERPWFFSFSYAGCYVGHVRALRWMCTLQRWLRRSPDPTGVPAL